MTNLSQLQTLVVWSRGGDVDPTIAAITQVQAILVHSKPPYNPEGKRFTTMLSVTSEV